MALNKAKPTEETNAEISQESTMSATAANEPDFDKGEDKSGAAEQTAATPKQEVTTKPSTAVSTTVGNISISGNQQVTVTDNAALGGLKLDAFSFPIIVQEKGTYRFSDDNSFLGNAGKSFEMIINSTRAKHYYKQVPKVPNEEVEGHYSFDEPGDEAMTTGGEFVAEITAKWEAEGWKWECKDYLDVQGIVVDEKGGPNGTPGEHHGKFATLSVSPTSVGKISGKILEIVKRFGSDTTQYVVEFSAPTKVGTGDRAFYPFSMRYVRPVAASAAA